MLYLVGGVARAGKSRLASLMNQRHGVPWLALDAVRWALTQGAPSLGVDSNKDDREDAQRLAPILTALIENVLFDGRDYLIEGVSIFPAYAETRLAGNHGVMRACFLGYPNIDVAQKVRDVEAYDATGHNDWLRREGPKKAQSFLSGAIERSRQIEVECKAVNLPFFDTGRDFDRQIDGAIAALLA